MIFNRDVPKQQVSRVSTLPAPVGGLNARDGLANMDEKDAVVLENWFPETTSVNIRNGHVAHKTGIGQDVETLAVYNDGVSQELYAVANGSIYNATIAGAVGAAVVSGLSNSRFRYVSFGTAGGFFLLMVNGEDKLRYYDGASWDVDGGGTYTITGVDTATCTNINIFKNRLWLVEKETLSAWYLPVSSVAGAANELNLSGLFRLGGYLVTMANWTIDNAAGIDDYAAFITSEGEVALYKGTDPSSANTWSLVGTFRVGKPIGYNCAIKAGADVLLLTEDGAFPLSRSLLTDRGQNNLAITDKISQLFLEDARAYKSNFGWQPIIYPTGNKLIINVPTVENAESHQYVMNVITGSWCKFTGWNAICFAELGGNLYFGGSGTVYQCDTGQNDNGDNIRADAQQAFSYFGTKSNQKRFTMVRPIFQSEGNIQPALFLNVDFGQQAATSSPSFTEADGSAVWNVAEWYLAEWLSGDKILRRWQTVTGIGYCAGLRIKADAKNIGCKWNSTDFVYETGGVL